MVTTSWSCESFDLVGGPKESQIAPRPRISCFLSTPVMVTVMTMVERRVMMTLTMAFLLTGSVSFIVRALKFAGF